MEDYGFLFFAINIGKRISKTLSKNYNQKLLDHAKISATAAIKNVSKKYFKKQQKQFTTK